VVPSRWNEPFGVVAVEALACGCRVLAAESGALPSIVGQANVYQPNTPDALAARLEEMLWGQQSESYGEEYALDKYRPECVTARIEEVLCAVS